MRRQTKYQLVIGDCARGRKVEAIYQCYEIPRRFAELGNRTLM